MPELKTAVKKQESSTGSFILLVSGAIMLGTVGVASALFNREQTTPPLMITLLRLGFSAIFLLIPAARSRHRNPITTFLENKVLFSLMGLAMTACQGLFFLAIPISSVTLVVVISLCSAPVIVAIFSVALFKERLTATVTLSISLAIIGTVALAVGGSSCSGELFRTDYLLGAVLALASGFAYSCFMMLSQVAGRKTSSSSLEAVALSFGFGTLLLLPLVFLTGSWKLDLTPLSWGIAVYMGLVPTGLAYYFIQLALEKTSATSAVVVTLLEPAVAALLSWLLLGEALTLVSFGGMCLLIFSVLLLARNKA